MANNPKPMNGSNGAPNGNGAANGSANGNGAAPAAPAVHIPKPGAKQDVRQNVVKDPYTVIPHISTYSGKYNTVNKDYYIYWDEALRNSQANTLAMRRDGLMEELLRHRQLPILSIPYHMEVDDPEHPDQNSIGMMVEKIVNDIPRLKAMMLSLLEAIFYGRYGSQMQLGPRKVSGNLWTSIVQNIPINGDKFRYKWDGTPGIAVYQGDRSPTQAIEDNLNGFMIRYKEFIETTMLGPALFLKSQELRDRFIIHRFQGSDTDYLFEIDEAQAVFGLGLRSRFYWTWNLYTEILSWIINALQRIGASGLIYGFYPSGNDKARIEVLNTLKQLSKDTIGAFPVPMSAAANGNLKDWLQRIEPSAVGYEVMERLLERLEGIMRRGILGQDLSSKSSPTGIGGGAALLQGDVRQDTLQYDANMLAETLTEQLVSIVVRYNKWKYEDKVIPGHDLPFGIRWKFDFDKGDGPARVQAAGELFQMGVPLDQDEVRKAAGFSAPKKKATALINHQLEQTKLQNEAGQPQFNEMNKSLKGLVNTGKQGQQMGMLGGSNGKSRFAKPKETFSMAGRLYLSKSGWGLMKVPNGLVRGIFDAIHESGVILPPQDSDLPKSKWKLNAHVSILRPEEIEKAGGPNVITEWGHHFHYQLGPIKKVSPDTWDGVKEVYFVDIDSPELEDMREKYGLSRLPNKNKFRFHITVAVRMENHKGTGKARFRFGVDCGHDKGGSFARRNVCGALKAGKQFASEAKGVAKTTTYLADKTHEEIKELAHNAFNLLPEKVKKPLSKAGQVYFSSFKAANHAAKILARKHGYTKDQANNLASILACVDLAGSHLAQMAAEPVGGPGLAAAAGMVPVASAAYLALSASKHPRRTLSAAHRAVKRTMRDISRFAKDDDCGHDPNGDFSFDNVCAGKDGTNKFTDNDNKNIIKLLENYRKEIDDYYDDENGVQGSCQYEAKKLADELKSKGLNAKAVAGYYRDVDEDFEPDLDQWDDEDITSYNKEVDKYGKPIKMPHWWVVLNNDTIIDLTSDQFHPSEKDAHKIIVTNINDKRYSSKKSPKSRFAKAGDPSDCGHETPGPRGGKFAEGNTCRTGGKATPSESRRARKKMEEKSYALSKPVAKAAVKGSKEAVKLAGKSGKEGLRLLGKAEHKINHLAEHAASYLPSWVKIPVKKAKQLYYSTFKSAWHTAKILARHHGYTAHEAEHLVELLAGIDLVAEKVFHHALEAFGPHVEMAALPIKMIPVASTIYLASSFASHPRKTIKAAHLAVRKTIRDIKQTEDKYDRHLKYKRESK